jgi:hypothetical protein
LLQRLIDVQISTNDDIFRWSLTQSSKFMVKSMYLDLLNDNTVYLHKYLWKMKVPLKTNIFMWFLHRKEILIKDDLIKINCQGCKKVYLCDHDETIQHLFIHCPFARIIWQIIHMYFNITPPLSIAHLFGIGLMELQNLRRQTFEWEFVLYSQLYGMFAMTLSLTNHVFCNSCRLFIWLSARSVCGPISSRWSSTRPWILGAAIWRW